MESINSWDNWVWEHMISPLTNRHSSDRQRETCLFDAGLKSATREERKTVKICARLVQFLFYSCSLSFPFNLCSRQAFQAHRNYIITALSIQQRNSLSHDEINVRSRTAVAHLSVLKIISTMPMLSTSLWKTSDRKLSKNIPFFLCTTNTTTDEAWTLKSFFPCDK